MTTPEQIADVLLDIGAVTFMPDQPVTFKSGIVSPVYVDNRKIPFHPQAWQVVIDGFKALIEAQNLRFDAIAGIEAAGIPHSAALGYAMQRPSLFVRKKPKEHGKGKQVEGGEVDNIRVLLVEDLVTTGGSSLAGVEALRREGATVTDCIAIVSYGFGESARAFEKAGVKLHILAPFEVIAERAHERGLFDDEAAQAIADWHNAPVKWMRKR